MIRMQRSREKESKEKDLVRHSLECLIHENVLLSNLFSGTSEWQPGLPGFLLRHTVSSSQYLPSQVENVTGYRVYNTWVLRRSLMTHKDCTECLFFLDTPSTKLTLFSCNKHMACFSFTFFVNKFHLCVILFFFFFLHFKKTMQCFRFHLASDLLVYSCITAVKVTKFIICLCLEQKCKTAELLQVRIAICFVQN